MEANYNQKMGIEKSKKRAKKMAFTIGKINRAMKSDDKEVKKDDADDEDGSTAESGDESGSEEEGQEELLEQEETIEVDKEEKK